MRNGPSTLSFQLEQFEERMKYSNECRRLAQLLLVHRDSISLLDTSAPDALKPYKDLLVDLAILDPNAKERVVELLKYQHHLDEARVFADWVLPRFPITGDMLASKGIKRGPTYKLILNELREVWKQSYFQADERDLLDRCLPTIVENLTQSSGTDKHSETPSKASPSTGSLSKKRKQKD